MKHGLVKSLARKLLSQPVSQLHQEVELGEMVWWVVELLEQRKRGQAGNFGLQCDLFAFISCLFQGLSFCFVIVLFSRWQAGHGTMLLGGFLLICHALYMYVIGRRAPTLYMCTSIQKDWYLSYGFPEHVDKRSIDCLVPST